MQYDPHEIALQVMKGYVNRAYQRTAKAWYSASILKDQPDVAEDISIGFYFPFEEGTYGEFTVQWVRLSNKLPTPRVKMFEDIWHLLDLFKDFFDLLKDVADPTTERSMQPDEFCKRLDALGFVDDTSYEQKKKKPEPDYAAMPLKAGRPFRVHKAFEHMFDAKLPWVVPFFGGNTFENGVITNEVGEWIEANCEYLYRCYDNDVLFETEEDALLCHMRFS